MATHKTERRVPFKMRKEGIVRTLNEDILLRVEEYIKAYNQEHGLSPSYRQIMHALKFPSLSGVQRYVLALERNGRIRRTNLGNIEVPEHLKAGEATYIPLVGQIACGQPTLSEENIEETFAFPKTLFGSGKLFMLRAFGDSMIDAGIKQGDLIVLRQQNSAESGDIVVALVDGKNTLKRFYKKGKKIVLHPENKTMTDIIVEECEIQGVLVSCIKMY